MEVAVSMEGLLLMAALLFMKEARLQWPELDMLLLRTTLKALGEVKMISTRTSSLLPINNQSTTMLPSLNTVVLLPALLGNNSKKDG